MLVIRIPMARVLKAERELAAALKDLFEQQKWIQDRGGSLPGYVLRYGSHRDPDHYGDGGEAIYLADQLALKRAEERVVEALKG